MNRWAFLVQPSGTTQTLAILPPEMNSAETRLWTDYLRHGQWRPVVSIEAIPVNSERAADLKAVRVVQTVDHLTIVDNQRCLLRIKTALHATANAEDSRCMLNYAPTAEANALQAPESLKSLGNRTFRLRINGDRVTFSAAD